MVTPRELELAERLKIRLQESLGDRFLALRAFGSRVRGDARLDSDFDLLVMVDQADRNIRRTVAHLAADLRLEEIQPLLLSTLVMDPVRLTFLCQRERRLGLDIQRESVAK